MAFVFAPDGTPGEIPDEQLQTAVQQGYVLRKPSDEEWRRADAEASPVTAGAEGFMRGVTGGLSDKALVEGRSWLENRPTAEVGAEIKARKEANPLLSGGTELVGAVGTGLATGGGASALVGGGVKGAAFEGGLYGMGSVISESALENTDLTAERLGASFAAGGLATGAVSGVLAGVGKGASSLMGKFGGQGLKDTLAKTADDLEWRALTAGLPAKDVERNSKYKDFILRYANKRGILGRPGTAADADTAALATELKTENYSRIARSMEETEGYVPMKGDASLRNESADYIESRLKKFDSPVYEDARKQADKIVEHIRNKDMTWGQFWRLQEDLFKEGVPNTATAEVREETRQAMRDFLLNEVATGKREAGKILVGVEPKGGIKTGTFVRQEGFDQFADPEFQRLMQQRAPAGTVTLEGTPSFGPKGEPNTRGVFRTGETPLSDVPNPEFRAGPYQPESNAFYLPQQEVSRPLTVRLGEDAMQGGGVLSGLPEAVGGGTLPGRVRGTPMRNPATVVIGTEEGAASGAGLGGFVMDVPKKQTPEWFGAHLRQLGQETAASNFISKALNARVSKLAHGGLDSKIANLTVGAAGYMLGNPLTAVAGVIANQQIQKRGGFLAASALRALAESKVSSGISKALSGHLGQILSVAPEMLGAYRFPLAQAAALGADALVAEHVRLASGPYGQDYMARAALPAESAQEVEAAGRRLALLDAIQRHSDTQEADLNSAIDGMFGTAPGRKASAGKPMTAREFENVKAGLYAATAQPDRAFEQIPADLRAVAPGTTAQAASVALRGQQFLLSKAPKDPNEGMPASVRPPWSPSAVDLDKFSQYKEAVEDPGRVLKNMANGFVSPEQVEAIKAVYPTIYNDLQQKIGERLASWEKPLSYKQKLAFQAFLGVKALGMSPQQAQVLQQAHTLALGQNSGQGSPGKRPDGRQAVNEAQMETESQKLEARRGR